MHTPGVKQTQLDLGIFHPQKKKKKKNSSKLSIDHKSPEMLRERNGQQCWSNMKTHLDLLHHKLDSSAEKKRDIDLMSVLFQLCLFFPQSTPFVLHAV